LESALEAAKGVAFPLEAMYFLYISICSGVSLLKSILLKSCAKDVIEKSAITNSRLNLVIVCLVVLIIFLKEKIII
jgi:hypothetical protein